MIAHDIVERLRTENSVQLSLGRDLSDLLLDAALEIERLRLALAVAWCEGHKSGQEVMRDRAVNCVQAEGEDADLRSVLADNILALPIQTMGPGGPPWLSKTWLVKSPQTMT